MERETEGDEGGGGEGVAGEGGEVLERGRREDGVQALARRTRRVERRKTIGDGAFISIDRSFTSLSM